jgi:hypothetical protein
MDDLNVMTNSSSELVESSKEGCMAISKRLLFLDGGSVLRWFSRFSKDVVRVVVLTTAGFTGESSKLEVAMERCLERRTVASAEMVSVGDPLVVRDDIPFSAFEYRVEDDFEC